MHLDEEILMAAVVFDLALVFLSQPAHWWPCRFADTRHSYPRPDRKAKRHAGPDIP